MSKTLKPNFSPSTNVFFRHSSHSRRYPPLPDAYRATFCFPGNGKESVVEPLAKPSTVLNPCEKEDPAHSKSVNLDDVRPHLPGDSDGKDQNVLKNQATVGRETYGNTEKVNINGFVYYNPKPGDVVVGVVVSGNDKKVDVNVGADLLGSMLTTEVLPLYGPDLPYLCFDLEKDAEDFMAIGKMGVVKDEEAMSAGKVPGRPAVETGTVIIAEVLGRTLSGRPLLSSRRVFGRVAWHRLRQIKQFNEPIEVKIFQWNTGGLLTRIEGLRAFLPKTELLNRVNGFMDLKKNVGRRMLVSVIRIDEMTNVLIISERDAWEMMYLKEGTLLEGSIHKIFPFGAQVMIGETNISGLLHISNISQAYVVSVSDVLEVDEKVRVLVVKSMFPDQISLSIADLESKPGLFLSDKKKVYSEAEEMRKRYNRLFTNENTEQFVDEILPFNDDSRLYANWEWFEFIE